MYIYILYIYMHILLYRYRYIKFTLVCDFSGRGCASLFCRRAADEDCVAAAATRTSSSGEADREQSLVLGNV